MNASFQSRVEARQEELQSFCRRHHVRKMSFFGSVLRPDFGAESDLDVLVEFDPGYIPGLEFVRMRQELSQLLGRDVDLRTPASLSRYFRDEVLSEAELIYGAA